MYCTESVLRNPLIAEILYYSKDIERWGTGIKRINEECTKNNVKVNLKKEKGGFSVVFYKYSGEVVVKKGAEKPKERLVEGLVERLVENQKKILVLMKQNPYISKKDLSLKLGISSTAIDKNISSLKKKGLLQRVGPDKGGYWEVKKD